MNTWKTEEILLALGFMMLIWILIMYWTIRSANDTGKRNKIQIQNQKLLALLAEKMGVDIADIRKAISDDV